MKCGNSSVGRALASQAKGREFESRLPLNIFSALRAYPLLSGFFILVAANPFSCFILIPTTILP